MFITALPAPTPLVARRAQWLRTWAASGPGRSNSGGVYEVARAGSSCSLGVGSVAGFVRHADRSERASAAGFPHGPPPRLHFIVLADWKPLLRHPHLWLPEQRERVRRRIRAWSRRLLRRHRRTGRGTIAGESVGLKLGRKVE